MILKIAGKRIKGQRRIVTKRKFVCARPSLVSGAARLFDFGGTLNTYYRLVDENPNEADARAIAADWRVVGGDIAVAIEHYDDVSSGPN